MLKIAWLTWLFTKFYIGHGSVSRELGRVWHCYFKIKVVRPPCWWYFIKPFLYSFDVRMAGSKPMRMLLELRKTCKTTRLRLVFHALCWTLATFPKSWYHAVFRKGGIGGMREFEKNVKREAGFCLNSGCGIYWTFVAW